MTKPSVLAATIATLLSLTIRPASALTVSVAQDTSSTTANIITPATGKATSLVVSAKQSAFVRFDLSDTTVVPAGITASNISSATLRLYVIGTTPLGLTVHTVTSDWTEKPLDSSDPIPTVNPTALATILGAEVIGKNFITVDVTAAVKAALSSGGNDFGFAVRTTSAVGKVLIASKEGPGIGAAAQLEIEANVPDNAAGDVSVPGAFSTSGNATIAGALSVSTCFVVEARPNSTGGLNNFVGSNAGAANTTGLGNTFVGHNCGKSNIGGSSNSFFGLNAGSTNTTGQLNVFLGQGAGAFNDTGSNNNFVGQAAGFNAQSGNNNNFFGWHAGFNNSAGNNNAFFGDQAGAVNNANNNAFFGSGAGASNFSGTQDCFFGINAGNKSTASFNSFFGAGAGQATTSGQGNTFFGSVAGLANTTGSNNTFLGRNTGGGITIESGLTFIGDSASATPGVTNSTAIGASATVATSNSLVLGSINGQNGATADTFVGIRTSSPNSTLQVAGSLSLPIRTINNSILSSLGDTDYVLLNTGTIATSVLLPSPGISGRVYIIKNKSTAALTLGFSLAGPLIEGAATLNIPTNTVAQVICDGTNWFKIN